MAAERLTAGAWTSFAKKKDLDDGALVKALTRYEAIDEGKHDARLDALDEIVSQGNRLVIALAKKKPPLPDKEHKEAKDKLHALIEAAERAQKDTRGAKAESSRDEEEESPALLTTRMVPLLREVKKGDVQMPVMVSLAGKLTALLIMRRSISPARRKLLNEYMGVTSGVKYGSGYCLLEKGAVTFVMQMQASGMAKRIRQAILDQTGQRLKVRVRGEDGAEDLDGEDEGEGQEGQGSEPGSQGVPQPPSPDELNWQQRWPRVRAAGMQALQGGQHPEAAKLRALLGFASEKAVANKDYAAGLKALDQLEPLLKATPTTAPGPTATPQPTAARQLAPAIVYTQSRLAWVATRGRIKVELDKLEKTILDHYRQHAVLPAVVQGVRKLDGVLQMFDESLNDQLDNALNSSDAAEKARFHQAARKIIERYQGFLATDPFVRELDQNPFVPVAVRATLEKTLKTLASKIV